MIDYAKLTSKQLESLMEQVSNEIYSLQPRAPFHPPTQEKIQQLRARFDSMSEERDSRENQ